MPGEAQTPASTRGPRLARGAGSGHGRGLCAGRVQNFCHHRGKRGQGLGGARPLGFQHQLVPETDVQGHDRDQALGVGYAAAAAQAYRAGKALGFLRQHRRGPGVKTGGIGYGQFAGGYRPAGALFGARALFRLKQQLQQHVASRPHLAGGVFHGGDKVHVHRQHLSHQAAGFGGHQVGVELQQRLPGLHTVSRADLQFKPFAFELHGVHAHVDHQFHALHAAQGEGVAGRVCVYDLARAGRQHHRAGRVNRHPVADDALGKNRVGHIGERYYFPVQRRQQAQRLLIHSIAIHIKECGLNPKG